MNRRYEEAIKMYRKALELTPDLLAARAANWACNSCGSANEDEAR